MNEDFHNSAMSLTIDELRWLQFSRVMDLPSRSSSPSPVSQHSQCESSQYHDACALHNQNPKLSHGSNTSFHRSSLDSIAKPQYKSASISIGAENSFKSSGLYSSNLSRSLPSGSSCQEWIYRRPNKTTGHARSLRPVIPSRSRVHPPHSMDQGKLVLKPLASETSDGELNAIPFWSTLLRSRSRSDRSVSSLKARPSRAQLVISKPFTPLPTISSDPNETTLISTTIKHPHLRTPSITSTASTASTSSTRLGTPTIPSFSRNAERRNETVPGSFVSQHTKPEPDYPPLSSSCPPSKSILASVSTRGFHTPSATSGLAQSKSVKFANIPTVRFASTADCHSSNVDEIGKIGIGQHANDTHIGIGIEGMDIDRDIYLRGPERAKELCHSPERAIEVLCYTPTPEKERERATALKRLMSLKQSAVAERGRNDLSTASRRPTISGPYALGTVQSMSTNDTTSSIPPLLLSQQSKEPSLLSATDSDQNRLRNAPSLESVRSTRSIGARSILNMKGAASIRGLRGWIETNIAPNIRLNLGSGWSLT